MDDKDAVLVAELLEKKAGELLSEQRTLRRRLFVDLARDREIDRRILDCVAGARALGYALELPDGERTAGIPLVINPQAQLPHIARHLKEYVRWRNDLSSLAEKFVVEEDESEGQDHGISEQTNDERTSVAQTRPAEMPKISDIVLDRLKVAGEKGSKAARIEEYVEITFGKKLHPKTIGMTLYRLQKEGLVSRKGHIWFLAPVGAENPGGSTPGPEISSN